MNSFQARQLGKYILLDQLAVGGMAELYRAMITSVQGFEKLIAIKKILPHLATEEYLVSSFIDEAKLAALLHHQNIVQIYDFGSLDGTYFIAMEYILGKDCRIISSIAKEKNTPLGLPNALLIVSRICAGLDYAHKLKDFQGKPLNIIHRDISPQNILITYEGDVKIVDFGIAKAASQNTRTQMGMIKGKVAYMSPEQAAGKAINHRSDIFSCGIILYELITGKRMFSGDTMHILSNVIEANFAKPDELQKDLPQQLIEVFNRALQKDPEDRYQTCGEMLNDLEKCMQLDMHPTAQGLSKYMKTLFDEEIRAEEQHLQQLTQIGLMQKGKKETPPAISPDMEQPVAQTAVFPKDAEEKMAPGHPSTPAETSKTKKTLIMTIGAGLLFIIILIAVSGRNGDKAPSPPDMTTISPQITEKPPVAPVTKQPEVAAETPGTETYRKAMKALVEKRFEEAISLFQELLGLGPGMKEKIAAPYAEALLEQANSIRETDIRQAITLLNESIQLDPGSEQAHFQLGLLLMKEKDYAGAIESYGDVIELNPEFPDTFFNLGFIYASTKDYIRAEEMYTRVVELSPDYVDEALFNLALVENKLGKNVESLANLEQAVKLNPQNDLAQSYLKKMKKIVGENP